MAFRGAVSAVTFPGCSEAPEGLPAGSILAVRGVSGCSSADLSALLSVARATGIPVDSLACTIAQESAFDASALNDVPAAGWIQVTRAAGLPGLTTREAIVEVASQSGAWQCEHVLLPFFRAYGSRLVGADPGRVYLAVFWPAAVDAPDAFVIADRDAGGWSARVYQANSGLDVDGDGILTAGDVRAKIAALAAEARGGRVFVASPAGSSAGPPAGPPAGPAAGPSAGPVARAESGGAPLLVAGLLGVLGVRLWSWLKGRRS